MQLPQMMPKPLSAAAHPPPAIRRERRPGLDLAIVHRQGLREFHFTLKPLPGEGPWALWLRLHDQLREHEAVVVKQDVFGPVAVQHDVCSSIKNKLGKINWPITWVEGAPCRGGSIAGMQVLAVAGAGVEPLVSDGRVLGCVFHDAWSKHCVLGDLLPSDFTQPKTAQTQQVFERIETALNQAGMVLSDVVRTWLFLDQILSWYGPFNDVRTEIFTQKNLFSKWVPASTGVGARNPTGAGLVAGAWAVQPTSGPVTIGEVASPLQCEARQYGSCFSRALEIRTPGDQRLFVSGTASIEPGGRSAYLDDMKGQIDLTMSVVEAILAARHLSFADVTRATAYFKRIPDAPIFAEWCAGRGLGDLPLVMTQADICRDELLFEIELDAMAVTSGSAETPVLPIPVKSGDG